MSSSTPDGWFEILSGALIAALTGICAWMQFQIVGLRRDDERAEGRAVEAIKALRAEFNQRHDDHVKVQLRQHDDNRAEMAAVRSLIQSNADAATLDRRRVLDSQERMTARLGEMADRKEVTALIAAMKP